MRLPWRTRRDLCERLRPYAPDRIAPESMVDADPIRILLLNWMAESGDSVDVVARGLALDRDYIRAILGRSSRTLAPDEFAELEMLLNELVGHTRSPIERAL